MLIGGFLITQVAAASGSVVGQGSRAQAKAGDAQTAGCAVVCGFRHSQGLRQDAGLERA